jgi:hypothetical protein
VRLNLAPAYPDELSVAFYVREFIIDSRVLLVRDEISLDRARALAWHFQSKREYGIELDERNLSARFGGDGGIRLQVTTNAHLQISQRETSLVWSYHSPSGHTPFDHVRYESQNELQHAALEFRFDWTE